jgi:DNA-binding transcriptional ArsR family regulator
MSLAAVSKHIHVLARAGLVALERRGRGVTCRLVPDGLRAAGIWMQGLGGFDPEDLDAIEALLLGVLEDDA